MTTAELTLIDFLLARIAEDEGDARAATSGPWEMELDEPGVSDVIGPWSNNGTSAPLVGSFTDDDAAHIARHDPARVRAECAAKRSIVEEHRSSDRTYCDRCRDERNEINIGGASSWLVPGFIEAPCPTLRALVGVYADHPDYREDWR